MAGWAARISSLETTQAVAFAMAKHARLGADSPAAVLTQDDCRLIFKLIREEHAALIQVKRLIDIEVWTSERIDRIELHYYGGIDSREAVGAGPRTDGWRRPVSFAPGDYLTGISVTCFPSAYGNDVDDRKLKAELLDGDGLHPVPQFCSKPRSPSMIPTLVVSTTMISTALRRTGEATAHASSNWCSPRATRFSTSSARLGPMDTSRISVSARAVCRRGIPTWAACSLRRRPATWQATNGIETRLVSFRGLYRVLIGLYITNLLSATQKNRCVPYLVRIKAVP